MENKGQLSFDINAFVEEHKNDLLANQISEAPLAVDEQRQESKYIISIRNVEELLLELSNNYPVFCFDNHLIQSYENRYFDDQHLTAYHHHHQGRYPRLKFRLRKYNSTNVVFKEIKRKQQANSVVKERESAAWDYQWEDKVASLENSYVRICFVDNTNDERITLDFNLNCRYQSKSLDLSHLVVIELKQKQAKKSPLYSLLLKHKVKQVRFSKYALGMAMLDPQLKRNNFRSTIKLIEKWN